MRQEQTIDSDKSAAAAAAPENYLPSYLNWAIVGLGWCVLTMTVLDTWFVLEGFGYFAGGLLLALRRNTAAGHRLVVLGAGTGLIGTLRMMFSNGEIGFALAVWVIVELAILGRHLLAFDGARRLWSSVLHGDAPAPDDRLGSRTFEETTSGTAAFALWVAVLGALWCLVDLAIGVGGIALGGFLQGIFQAEDNLFTHFVPGWFYGFAVDIAFVASAIGTRRGGVRSRRVFLVLAGAEAWNGTMSIVAYQNFSVMAIASGLFWVYGFLALAPRGPTRPEESPGSEPVLVGDAVG